MCLALPGYSIVGSLLSLFWAALTASMSPRCCWNSIPEPSLSLTRRPGTASTGHRGCKCWIIASNAGIAGKVVRLAGHGVRLSAGLGSGGGLGRAAGLSRAGAAGVRPGEARVLGGGRGWARGGGGGVRGGGGGGLGAGFGWGAGWGGGGAAGPSGAAGP